MRDQQTFYLDMRRSQEELGKTRGPAFLCREHIIARDPQSQAGRTICASIQNNSVLPQGRRLGVLAQSNPSKSGGVRLEAAFKPRGADHVYTPEASDPL